MEGGVLLQLCLFLQMRNRNRCRGQMHNTAMSREPDDGKPPVVLPPPTKGCHCCRATPYRVEAAGDQFSTNFSQSPLHVALEAISGLANEA
jgi:hypothetical protein